MRMFARQVLPSRTHPAEAKYGVDGRRGPQRTAVTSEVVGDCCAEFVRNETMSPAHE